MHELQALKRTVRRRAGRFLRLLPKSNLTLDAKYSVRRIQEKNLPQENAPANSEGPLAESLAGALATLTCNSKLERSGIRLGHTHVI